MTKLENRCPFRYYNHLANTSPLWDNRCKFTEGHEGEHKEAGMIINSPVTQANTFQRIGWVKE